MFKLSALVATATLCLSTSAFAGSTAIERLGRVLSALGQRNIENTQVVRDGGETIVRGTIDGRPVNVRVRREETVERRIRFKAHTRRPDADDTTSAPRQTQPAARAAASTQPAAPAPAGATPAEPTPAEASQINRLADETGMPKAPEQQTAETQVAAQDDGLRDLPARDMGAIYDTKDATVKAKQPSFSLGQLDMAKGPRSSPAILPE